MTDEELIERLWRYFGDRTLQELELIDVVRGATGTDPVTARERVHSLVGAGLVRTQDREGKAGYGFGR